MYAVEMLKEAWELQAGTSSRATLSMSSSATFSCRRRSRIYVLLFSTSDNAHTSFCAFRSQLPRGLRLSRLSESRKGTGAAHRRCLHHRHRPVRRISGKAQAHAAERASQRRPRLHSATICQLGRWPLGRTKAFGAAPSLSLSAARQADRARSHAEYRFAETVEGAAQSRWLATRWKPCCAAREQLPSSKGAEAIALRDRAMLEVFLRRSTARLGDDRRQTGRPEARPRIRAGARQRRQRTNRAAGKIGAGSTCRVHEACASGAGAESELRRFCFSDAERAS